MPRTPGDKYVLGALDAKTASRLVRASSDVALVLDGEGTILDVVIQGDDAAAQQVREWRGRSWVQTVSAESRQKVEALLRDAQAAADAQTSRWRQVNHPIKDSEDFPMLYSAVRIADDTKGGSRGRIVAFGRDLRSTVALQRRLIDTQQAMERDYWRFREAETRYRHLLETSSEAVLIVDGSSQKVLEANPAARALCGGQRAKLVGASLVTLFELSYGERLQDLLAAARSVGKQEPMQARLADSKAEVTVSASVFRQEEAAFVLVRITTAPTDPAGSKATGAGRRTGAGPSSASTRTGSWEATLGAFVQNSPDGLVFCDAAGKVFSANRAFLSLVELSGEDQARGQPLDRWLGRTGVELGVLITNLRQRGSVGRFVTALRGEYGKEIEVEISAAQLGASESAVLAFAIRDIERRIKSDSETGNAMTRSVSELTELVGRTPLKDIVSETTDLIEQLCIEIALEMSNDNRASAALLLGLSRQSLYVKLRRYGLGSLGSEE
jgi:transcriptional regulator PpsR